MTWDERWSPEEWQRWKAEREATRTAATVPGDAAKLDDRWTPEEWWIWREEQEDIHPAAALCAETANWGDRWTPQEWRVWRAMREAPSTAGAAPDGTTAAAFPVALPATPEVVPTVPSGDMLLRILAAIWNGPHDFVAEDWTAVSTCLEQHGINLLALAPARDVRVSWDDREFWRLACWWCGRVTDPVHSKMECEDHIEALTQAFRRLLDGHDYIPIPPPVFYGEPGPAEAPAPYPEPSNLASYTTDGGGDAPVPPMAPMPVHVSPEEHAEMACLMIEDTIMATSTAAGITVTDGWCPSLCRAKAIPKEGQRRCPCPRKGALRKGLRPPRSLHRSQPLPHRLPMRSGLADSQAECRSVGRACRQRSLLAEGQQKDDARTTRRRTGLPDPAGNATFTSSVISGAAAAACSGTPATGAIGSDVACPLQVTACTTQKIHWRHPPRGREATTGTAPAGISGPPPVVGLADGELRRHQARREHHPVAPPLLRTLRIFQ